MYYFLGTIILAVIVVGKRFVKPSKVTKDMDADRVSFFCLSICLSPLLGYN